MILFDIVRDKVFCRKLGSLAVPLAFQSLMLALVAAADALMLGHVHQDAMAAVSLATQIQFVQNMLLWSVVSGVGVLGAQYWGKRDLPVMEKIFGISVRETAVVSLCFFVGCRFFPEYLMRIFAHDPRLVGPGAEYLKMAAWSYLLTGLSQSCLAVMRVSGHAVRSAWISSGAVVLNIIFNALLIFGLFGIPAMGIAGAALATVLARALELGWCAVSVCEADFVKLRLRRLLFPDWRLICDFWHYTLPILGAGMLWGVGFTAYTAIMGHLGPDAAAANAVAAVVRDLMCCLCNGVAGGCAIMIGNELGAGKLRLGRIYGERSMVLAFVTGGVSMLAILAAIPLVSRFIPLTGKAHEYMVGMFLILSVYMVGRCVCTVVLNGIFYAGGDTLFDVYSLVVCMWLVALPCAFLGAFCLELPVLAVYACTCLDEVGKVPWVMLHYRRYKWVRNITR